MEDLHEHNSKQNIRVCLLALRFSLSSGLDKGDPYMKSMGVPVRNFEKNPPRGIKTLCCGCGLELFTLKEVPKPLFKPFKHTTSTSVLYLCEVPLENTRC